MTVTATTEAKKVFVPGRLCLFGEHTDWAGEYRCEDPQIEVGQSIIVGTNQGLHAKVTPSDNFVLHTRIENEKVTFTLNMDKETLVEEARKGGFISYAAGVAHHMMVTYNVTSGVEIDNYETDLPRKKGLSSSAAICVLVARAFSEVHGLGLTHRDEMEAAYKGEITTPSRCGRMDQACAYGNIPIVMTFDGHEIDVKELNVQGGDLHFVIVDLGAGKNTQKILKNLHDCYPSSVDSEVAANVRKFLGPISYKISRAAIQAIETGNAELIGSLMKQAQSEFDKHLSPACEDELAAPILHKLLSHPPLQPLVHGGKGVGSQGDGTGQFIARSAEAQQEVIDIIEAAFPKMHCLKLTIHGRKTAEP